jgi:hypothetical protein
MTVSELIEQLSKLPKDTLVYAWKGDRQEIVDIDDSLLEQGFIDLNIGE